MKNLANQTAKATEEIAAQITGDPERHQRTRSKRSRRIGGTIDEVNEIATAIAAAVEQQGAATREIARNVQQAAAGTSEVAANIAGVTAAADARAHRRTGPPRIIGTDAPVGRPAAGGGRVHHQGPRRLIREKHGRPGKIPESLGVLRLRRGLLAGDEARFREEPTMIDLYTWTTPNGRKVSIMLEESGLPYEVHPIDIGKDEQFAPEFLKISPNNKIPAIVDRDNGRSVFESGAILIYLAEKTGRFLPQATAAADRDAGMADVPDGRRRADAGAGAPFPAASTPARRPTPRSATARRPSGSTPSWTGGWARRDYLAGDEYTIADIATWPWVSRFEWQRIDLAQFPNVKRWYLAIAGRPGVQRGYDVPKKGHEIPLV